MVKKKYVEQSGQILEIPDEKAPEIIEVSYSKAKQLSKRPMSEKQKENIQKLVEMNRVKWEAQKKIKDEQFKKLQAEKEQSSTKVLVKPKRIYPPREKKQAPKNNPQYESDSEDAISLGSDEQDDDDQEVYQKSKRPPKVYPQKPNRPPQQAPRPDIQAMKSKLEQLENQLKPQVSNAYSGLASKFWKG